MYEWAKALHITAVIAWMAGMLYLPRLFVYHARAAKGSELSETFKVMERRLLRGIINPAMIVTWVLGLYLAWTGHWFSSGWFHGKLFLVLVMSGIHASARANHLRVVVGPAADGDRHRACFRIAGRAYLQDAGRKDRTAARGDAGNAARC